MRAIFILLVLSLLVFAGCKQAETVDTTTPPVAPEPVAPPDVAPTQVAPADAAQVESAVPQEDLNAIDSDMAEIEAMESDLDPSEFEDAPTI